MSAATLQADRGGIKTVEVTDITHSLLITAPSEMRTNQHLQSL